MKPEGERDLYTSIIYLEPFTGRNLRAFGYDMYSEGVRRNALEQARDLDKTTISGKVKLLQETEQQVQAGFLMYVPVYRNDWPQNTLDERRANIVGWVYAPFRMDDLMLGILGEQTQNLDLKIYDGEAITPEALMNNIEIDLPIHLIDKAQYHFSHKIEFAGHIWTIELHSLPTFEAKIDTERVMVIRLAGILTTLLLSFLVMLLSSGRSRALKLAESMTRELRASENNLRNVSLYTRNLIEASLDPLVTISSEGKITDVNIATERVTGVDRDNLIGSDFADYFTDPETARVGCQQVFYEGFVTDYPLAIRHVSGKITDVLYNASVYRNDNGEVQGILAAARDITERRRVEYILAKSEMKFRTLYTSTSEAVMLLDEQGFFDCNDAALAVFGCASRKDFYTRQPSDFSPLKQSCGRDSLTYYKYMNDKAIELGSYSFEWLLQRADNGKIFPADIVLSSMELDGKSVLLATVRDITDRKQYEEKIVQLAEAKDQLLQSDKMATVGQLAAGVAHELNNPIAFVYSNLGSLERYITDILEMTTAYQTLVHNNNLANGIGLKVEENFEYLMTDIFELIAESKDGLLRMKNIVADLKNFSRVGELECQSVDLHKGLDSTLNIVWHELKYKCTVIKDYSDKLPEVHCIASQLNQVFMNLLVNAGHAIEEKGTITITTRLCPNDNTSVQILISDTGKGIMPENLKRIFDPFFTTKPVGKGTGLGLSIVWGIIAKHHGIIDVSSTVDIGSTFTITLPIDQHDS